MPSFALIFLNLLSVAAFSQTIKMGAGATIEPYKEDERLKEQCGKNLCQRHKIKKQGVVDEAYRIILANVDGVKLLGKHGKAVSAIKKGFSEQIERIQSELDSPSEIPKDKNFNLAANLTLAFTDCEALDCSPQIKELVTIYDSLREDGGSILSEISKMRPESLRPYIRGQVQNFKSKYPRIYELSKEYFEHFLSKIEFYDKETLENYAGGLSLQLRVLGTSKLREVFERDPPTVKEIWSPFFPKFSEIEQNFYFHIHSCAENLSYHLATVPTSGEEANMRDEVIPEVRENFRKMIKDNFPAQCAERINGDMYGIKFEFSNREKIYEQIKGYIDFVQDTYSYPVPKDKTEKLLTAYNLALPDWLLHNCSSGFNIFKDTDHYNGTAVKISNNTVMGKDKQVIAHELMHDVDVLLHFESSQEGTCQKKLEDIERCLYRKNPYGPEFTKISEMITKYREDFADLAMGSFTGSGFLCDHLDPKAGFFQKDKKEHSSHLFRLLHIASYSAEPFPNSCKNMLKSMGQEHLFDEKCLVKTGSATGTAETGKSDRAN